MPSTEQKELVVHVLAKTPTGYNNASGFLVAPGRVLTVGHVLDGAESDLEVRLCEREPTKWIPAKPLWDGRRQGRDVAVLEFEENKLDPASRQICAGRSNFLINTGPWGSHVTWGSYGLPVVGYQTDPVTGKPVATPIASTGTTGSPNPGGDLDLCADAGPNTASGWAGASGSAVFIDHGLRAIVFEARTDLPAMLRALWIAPLLNLPAFARAIRWTPERDWVDILAKDVGTVLSKPGVRKLCEILAKVAHLKVTDPAAIARDLIALPAFDFLVLANQAAHELVGDGSQGNSERDYELAEVLEGIVESGLAAKLGLAMLSRLALSCRAGAGEALVRLPCMEIVLAEFYNAGLDGRPAQAEQIPPEGQDGREELWRDLRKEYPVWPSFCVPLSPILGFNVDPMDWARTALKHLAHAIGVSEIKRSHSTTEELAKLLNTRLETLAMSPGQPIPKRWYLLYLESQDSAPAYALKELLPQLRLCLLTKSKDPAESNSEERLITLLDQFHERKRKRASRP